MNKNLTLIDVRTPSEIRREKRDAMLSNDFKALVRQQPTAKPYRLFSVIGEKYSMSSYGVAKVLTRMGLYTPNV